MNKDVLTKLRDCAQTTDRPISPIVSEAVAEYLDLPPPSPRNKKPKQKVARAMSGSDWRGGERW